MRVSPQEGHFALSVTYKDTFHLLLFQNTVVVLWGGSVFDDHFAGGGSLFMRKVGPIDMSKNSWLLQTPALIVQRFSIV